MDVLSLDPTRAPSHRATVQVGTQGEAVDPLVARLAEEMARRWDAGEQPRAEEFLDRHPELWERPEQAARLIYEEICLRQERGEQAASIVVAARFPQWHERLAPLVSSANGEWDPAALPGDFQLVATLGTGRWGRVFLATQPALGNRPVVLKLTPCGGLEHVWLARLQHTHIVPIYSIQDDPARGVRTLCLPYFGGATLEHLLNGLSAIPRRERTGRHLLEALDRCGSQVPLAIPCEGPARGFLAVASYEQAVAWLGACLADALAYAHERGLVHLDVKPSNVLLAADAQPMLLDFHLAQPPLHPDGPVPRLVGGTLAYLSPEQKAALESVRRQRPVEQPVDGRSDVYSLGLVLYEALGGTLPTPAQRPRPLREVHPGVSVGLADVVARCLECATEDRYPSAGLLAADLRRHLTDQPLRGVPNRSLRERWRKWRRRCPHALAAGVAMLAAIVATTGLGLSYLGRRWHDAQASLSTGQDQLQKREYEQAAASFGRGLALTRALPLTGALQGELRRHQRRARQAAAAARLHGVADALRLHALDSPSAALRVLEANCRRIWEARVAVLEQLGGIETVPEDQESIRTDLLDLAVIGADLHIRLAPADAASVAHAEALRWLDEAEAQWGASAVLCRQRARVADALGRSDEAQAAEQRARGLAPRTAWEHYALGRLLMRAGELPEADREFRLAMRLDPAGRWPCFYHGLCAFRRNDAQEARLAFSVCCALAPGVAEHFYNRALAQAALQRTAEALEDYGRALELDPGLAAASLNRGLLYLAGKRYAEALADLRRAADTGADPATVNHGLALVFLARGEVEQARAHARQALEQDPSRAEARALRRRLQEERR